MKNIIAKTFFLLVLWSAAFSVSAQEVLDTIFINNPSFEHPYKSRFVQGWSDCSFPGETEFDPQPGFFQCDIQPADGGGYVGLVTRDVETYEAMSQRLSKPLARGKCYAFSLKLAKSNTYISASRATGLIANYDKPIRIRIWGSNSPCRRTELLAETGLITHTQWKTYNFQLKPLRSCQYIVIEAFYKTPTLYPYNGNVLVDAASNIFEIKCDEDVDELFAALEKKPEKPKKVVKPAKKKVKKPKKPKKEVVIVPEPVKKTKTKKTIMPELNKKVSKGQVLRIPNLIFPANSAKLPESCNQVMDELYHFLLENPTVKIELGGHSNNRCDTEYCNSLSEKRAKSVADKLIAKGIDPARITYKGYGKTNPIATNSTPEGRRKNQRVEVKVLSN